jgi:subtilisin family serine protease
MSHFSPPRPIVPTRYFKDKGTQSSFAATVSKLALLALTASLALPSFAQGQRHTAAAGGRFAAQELLVKFTAGPNSARAREIHKYVGTQAVQTFGRTGWQRLKTPFGLTAEKALQRFRGLNGVALVELNHRRHLLTTPNDPGYGAQWHHAKIGAPTFWDQTTGSASVVVAVIDTGLRLTHQDIAPNLWTNTGEIAGNDLDDDSNGFVDDVHGWNGAGHNGDPSDANFEGHGTHVAGLIGAVGNNGKGGSGVNWNVRLMPLRFIDSSGNGYDSDAIECYEYMLAQKSRGVNVRVVNCSWGGEEGGTALRDVIRRAGEAGVLTVAAAGNGDNQGIGQDIEVTPNYPASFDLDAIVSVAASDEYDNPATFTNYGARGVDLAAPGVDIYSTVASSDSAYAYHSGTSMAAPIVSGAAALILARTPGLSVAALKASLLDNVTKLPQWTGKVVSGGRLNLPGAIENQTYSVSGQVYRLQANQVVPLAGAKLTVASSESTTTTDSEGNYTLPGLKAGSYSLTVSLGGYTSSTVTVTLTNANQVANIELKVQPPTTYSISGRVVSETGSGEADVQIFLNGSTQVAGTTDSNGYYTLSGCAAGTYTVSAQKSGYTFNTPASVMLPTTGQQTSPNATVDFTATKTVTANPSLSIDDISVTEGNDGTASARFTIRLSAKPTRAVSVTYATAAASKNSATVGIDYSEKKGILQFGVGETVKTVTVAVRGDKIDEQDEGLQLKLTAPVNATIADSSGSCTIVDDDAAPSFSIKSDRVVEGNQGDAKPAVLPFTVTLSKASGRVVKVEVRTVPGAFLPATANSDFVALKLTTISFAPGEVTKTISVVVKGDALNEEKETVGLELRKPTNATLGDKAIDGRLTVEGAIVDDDAKPTLSINDVSVTEGNKSTKNVNITVTLSVASGREVTVDFAAVKGSASSVTDFTGVNGSLKFSPGQTSKTIALVVKGDVAVESDEKFTVQLSRSINASIAKAAGVVTIVNDDSSTSSALSATSSALSATASSAASS